MKDVRCTEHAVINWDMSCNFFVIMQLQLAGRVLSNIALRLRRWHIQPSSVAKLLIYRNSCLHFANLLRSRLQVELLETGQQVFGTV